MTISQTFLVFDDLESRRHAFRHDFVACSSIGICLMFVSGMNGAVWVLGGPQRWHAIFISSRVDCTHVTCHCGCCPGLPVRGGNCWLPHRWDPLSPLSCYALWKGVTVCSLQGLVSQVVLSLSCLLPEEFLLAFLVVSWQQIQHLFIWRLSLFLSTF